MSSAGPPELDKVFGSAFLRVGLALALLLGGYLIYRHATRPPLEVISANEVRLQLRDDGHYHVTGAINGTPIRFMIDTGASMVSVSRALAQRAGLECEQPATFTTANGSIRGCVALREEVEFGGYRVFDVDVAIMPNMDDVALLGMNALGRFKLEQSDGTLVIRHKQAE
jgi:clan AA aspartic protease (TIGR02281 family)